MYLSSHVSDKSTRCFNNRTCSTTNKRFVLKYRVTIHYIKKIKIYNYYI